MRTRSHDVMTAVKDAHDLASSLRHGAVRGEHLLVALVRQRGTAAQALDRLGIDGRRLCAAVESMPPEGSIPIDGIRIAADMLAAVEIAADSYRDPEIGTEHLLLGLWKSPGTARTMLAEEQVEDSRLLQAITAARDGRPVMSRLSSGLRMRIGAVGCVALAVVGVVAMASGGDFSRVLLGLVMVAAVMSYGMWKIGGPRDPHEPVDESDRTEIDELEHLYQRDNAGDRRT